MSYYKKTKNNEERRCGKMKKALLILALVLPYVIVSSCFAVTDKVINASASITGATSFDVKLCKGVGTGKPDFSVNLFPTMSFGTLTNAVATDPNSALTSANFFCAVASITNNTGTSYYVQYTGAPLKHSDAVTTLSNDAFTVIGALHYAADGVTVQTVNQAGLVTARHSAGLTTAYTIFNSNTAGVSDIFDVYFAVTGDPTKGIDANSNGTIDLIPPGQKSGSYSAQVKLSLYP
jgi:hypothetical protein